MYLLLELIKKPNMISPLHATNTQTDFKQTKTFQFYVGA